MSKINWGILGTSFISTVMARAIQESSVSRLVGVSGRSFAKSDEFAKQFSLPKAYSSYSELIEDPEIDVVYIGLPNHLHKEWIIHSAEAGKHILCEKPLVLDLGEIKEIFSAVKKADVTCMEALMYRCHPLTLKLQELIQSRIIGEIRFINASYTANIAAEANTTMGGAILNLGCYPMSLVRLLAGTEPVEMHSLGDVDPKRNNDNRASVILKFPNQIQANVFTADDMEMFSQFDVYGTEGYLKVVTNPWLPTQEQNKILIYRNEDVHPIEINVTAEKSLYTYQIDAVSNSVINGDGSVPILWEDSIGNVAVLEAWRKQVFASAAAVS